MITLNCKICNKSFSVAPYRKKIARCCSRKCLWEYTFKDREVKRLQTIIGKKPHNFSNTTCICKKCGKEFYVSPSREKSKKFCSHSCYAISQKSTIPFKGYKRISIKGKRYLEHRYLMEQSIGRKLEKWEHVHHINRDTHDNRIENLQILDSSTHGRLSSLDRGK